MEITLLQNPHEDQPLLFYQGSKVIPPTAGTNAIAFTSLHYLVAKTILNS